MLPHTFSTGEPAKEVDELHAGNSRGLQVYRLSMAGSHDFLWKLRYSCLADVPIFKKGKDVLLLCSACLKCVLFLASTS